MEELKDCAAQK